MFEKTSRQLGIDANKPTDWFETLYSGCDEGGKGVPRVNMAPHPVFKSWIDKNPVMCKGK